MNERFLENPNLPKNKVTTVFANIDENALKSVFDEMAIKVMNVTENPLLDTPVSKHADILANYVGKSTFLADKNQVELCKFIKNNGGKSIIIENIIFFWCLECCQIFFDFF